MGELENKSLWYKYKTDVWLKETPETTVIHNAMRVLRSIKNLKEIGYISGPITSGKHLYQLHIKKGTKEPTREMIEGTIDYNCCKSLGFIEELIKRGIKIPLVSPWELIPARQCWKQEDFQALWMSIISEMCTEIHITEGWEYSDGASEEFVHTLQLRLGIPKHQSLIFFNTKENEETARQRMKNIKIYNHLGHPISLGDGISYLENSLRWIKTNGFKSSKLEQCLELLNWTGEKIEKGFYQ